MIGEGERTRVAIVDDDELVRRYLRAYLDMAEDIDVVADCSSGEEALTALERTMAHVVLMDLAMPGQGGVRTTAALRQRSPQTRIVILTTYDEEEMVDQALAAGASGFLLKSVPPEALVDIVRGVRRGVVVMSDSPARRLRRGGTEDSRDRLPELSDRERDVLTLLCTGLGNAGIARELFMSESSVKGYVTTILRKFDAGSRLQAVVRAHELGFKPA